MINQPNTGNRLSKIIYVWDGTADSVKVAGVRLASSIASGAKVCPVYAMPNESIYNYGWSIGGDQIQPELLHQWIDRYMSHARPVAGMNETPLTLLFGDRISEVARFARRIRAVRIVVTRLAQSSFSKWLHGDLNQRLLDAAPCDVEFLEDDIWLRFPAYSRMSGFQSHIPSAIDKQDVS